MRISLRCPDCKRVIEFSDLKRDFVQCGECRREVYLNISNKMREQNVVDSCAVCGCEKVYVQKDFNRVLGVGIFLAGAVLFLILAWMNRLVEGTLVWVAFVIADAVLYKKLPEVTICYRCHSQYREFSVNPGNQEFELGLAEKYDPLDKRPEAENPAAEWKGR